MMIYFDDGSILIRDMIETDPAAILEEELAMGHHRTLESFSGRLKDRQAGIATPLVAEYKGFIAGYINVYSCEIRDLGVFTKYRNLGIGGKLMDIAEQIVAERSNVACLSVGLHSGYGAAQRMYARRGYMPDGSGVWYHGIPLTPYADCKNDDDLVLRLVKELR